MEGPGVDMTKDKDVEATTVGWIYWRTVLWGSFLWYPFFKIVEIKAPIVVILIVLSVNIVASLILVIMGYSDYKIMKKIMQGESNQIGVIADGQ